MDGSRFKLLTIAAAAAGLLPFGTLHAQNGGDDFSDLFDEQPAETTPDASSETVEYGESAASNGETVATFDDEAAELPTERRPRSRMVDEMVVTAQKREQDLQSVPQTVTAFTGQQLEAQGISDLKDLQLITPGLQFDSMASYSLIFIRGVGGDSFQAAVDSSVATYVDGLYLPFTFSSAIGLGDVEQIEVLKGPQGTLYGRNAVAGAILVKLKRPSFEEYSGSFLQELYNFDGRKTKGSFSGPVPGIDNLAFSVSGEYEVRDSYKIYFPDPSQEFIKYRNRGTRTALAWEPNDDLSFQLSYYFTKQTDSDSVATTLVTAAPAFVGVATATDRPRESGNNRNVGSRSRAEIVNLEMDTSYFDLFDLKAVLGTVKAQSNIFFDFDSAPEPILDISALPNVSRSTSLELLLNSNPFNNPDWLTWTAGAYIEDSDKSGRYDITVDALATGIGAVDGVLGQTGIFNTLFLCNDILTPLGLDCDDNPASNQNPLAQAALTSGVTTLHYSAYSQFGFQMTESLQFVLGGRFSVEERNLDFSRVEARVINLPLTSGNAPGLAPSDTITLLDFQPQSQTFNSFTPNAGLNWQVTDGYLAYFRYAEAFKSGNYNGLNINAPPLRIEPESASSNEIGLKAEMFDGLLTINTALFSTRVENAQVQLLALTSGGVTQLQNAGSYRIQGGEIDASWTVTDALVLSASAVYLDGEYENFVGQGFDPVSGLNTSNNDFSGNKTVRTPEWTGTLAASYAFALPFNLDGELSADGYYNDGFFYDPFNSVTEDSYKIINARFSVYDPDTRVRATLFGRNLTEDSFFTNKYRFDFGETGIWGSSVRLYGITLQWDF
jgi:iron complex outermembrane recepter protein